MLQDIALFIWSWLPLALLASATAWALYRACTYPGDGADWEAVLFVLGLAAACGAASYFFSGYWWWITLVFSFLMFLFGRAQNFDYSGRRGTQFKPNPLVRLYDISEPIKDMAGISAIVKIIEPEELYSMIRSAGFEPEGAYDGIINAYATEVPCPKIAVTKDAAEDLTDDELAYLVGHEAAHIALGHVKVKNVEKQVEKADLLSGIINVFVCFGLGGLVGPLAGVIGTIASSYITPSVIMSRQSQKKEFEADLYGTVLAMLCGHSPQGAIKLLSRFQREQENEPWLAKVNAAVFGTHPHPRDRIAAVRELLRKIDSGEIDLYEYRRKAARRR